MITDALISGLTNLFALFGAKKDIAVDYSVTTLKDYLGRHFGIRDVTVYIDLYKDLRELYSMSPDLDKEKIIDGVCTSIAGALLPEEQALMLLRLMEFCNTSIHVLDPDDEVFRGVAKRFNVGEPLYKDFADFVLERETEHVSIQTYDRLEGHITVLWLHEWNKLVFTYHGKETVLMDDVPVLNNAYQTWTQSGVLKVKKTGLCIYYSTAFRQFDTVQNYEDIEFCGRNIEFRFPNSDNGMHNMSFTLHSGELLAVMGGSGTGKTTLLSLLNGTLKPQSGTITINGHDISEPEAKALIGFVPQDDLLVEELTVYDNLLFTARLCFAGMSNEELDKRVTTMLTQLGLYQAKDLKVGSPLEKTISGGQRKRLNIALELIREPAVLFLDEPTSGLSSVDTEKVINLLKEQTYKGKLIITNIHQPSSDVYKLFDRLWLLDKGGYPVFDGNPIEAVTYFKTAANYADADSSTCPTCGNVNPEVVLNIIDEKALDSTGQMLDERKVTPQQWHEMYVEGRGEMETPQVSDVPHTDQKKPGRFMQFIIYLQRTLRTKMTNVQYLLITFLEAPILAAVCASLTHFSTSEGYTVMDNKNLVSYLFMAVIVAVFIGMSGSAEEIIRDRTLLKREKFLSLCYSSYISSKIFFMGGVVLMQTLLFVLIGNMIMGVMNLWYIWWIVLFVVAFLSGLIGLLLSQVMNSVVAIYISIPILLIPQILLCGLVVDFSDLTPDSKTGNVPVIGDVIPSRWAYEALAVSQFCDNAYERDLFDVQRKKYETSFYKNAYLYEVQSQLETMNDEKSKCEKVNPVHMDVIRKALPTVARIAQLPEYQGAYDYSSLKQYTDKAEDVLSDRSNMATLAEDNIVSRNIRALGQEEYVNLKRDNHNLRLEELVANMNSKHSHDIVDGYIVPRIASIFLTPQSQIGRAPFYSSVKKVGNTLVPTLWFNIIIQLIYSAILAILLYTDCIGKRVRKN